MASVYGSKVKEPKLTRRSELPFEKQSPYAADLAQAWASFGEAKSVLQRLERTSGSPPIKDRTQRRPKPYHVHFDPTRATGAERAAHHGHTKTYSSTLSSDDGVSRSRGGEGGGGKENSEYLVEPKPLNELALENMEHEPQGAYVGRTAPWTSDSSRAAGYKPGRTLSNPRVHTQGGWSGSSGESHPLPSSTTFSQRYDSTVRFSVPPATSIVHPSPPSHSHTITTTTSSTSAYPLLSAASPSNPNTIGSPRSRLAAGGTSAPPYSNATAVFGPPVKFGDHSGRHAPVSSRQPTMVRPVEVPKSYSLPVHSRSHATSANVHPRTSTATGSTQVAGVGASRSTVPIRTFELPTETLGTLRAKIELQKQAMRATSAKASNLLGSRNPTTSAATGFYPLPDASTTATSSFASSSTSVGGARPRVPHPPPTGRPPDTSERAAKRRKVASAPPPQTYTGFSTSTSGRGGTKSSSGAPATVSWKPNLESVGAVGGAGGVALPSSLPTGASGSSSGMRFSSQPPTSDTLEPPKRHLHMHTMASKTVRKVHKIPATNEGATSLSKPKSTWNSSGTSKPPPGASGLITTSSWRAGKELRDKVLRGENRGVDHGRVDYHSDGSRNREDTSPARYSSVSESRSDLSSSQENISAVSSSIDVHVQPERNRSASPSQAKTKDGVGSHGARVALDVAGMLKDLEGSESPPIPPLPSSPLGGRGEGRERERGRLGQPRSTTSVSGGPTSKKPQYNYEPSYPTERVRHYDQAEVQSYMQKKQEDRRRRELEEKQAREKSAKEREEKLKQLYESQRKRVEANLRVKQKQRLAYSKALATGDVHIHLHTGSSTSSTSTIGSTADPAAHPVPTLAVHPPTPISKSPTIGSLTLHVHADTDSTSGGLPKSAAMLSPHRQSSPLRPSPPSHSPTPPHTSPLRYSQFGGTSPTSSREASRSPSASPRTYSVPSSTSTSPKAHRSPPVSSEHAQLHHSPSSTGATHYGLHVQTEHAQYGHSSDPGQLSSLLRGASHTSTAISAPQSREERIRALTESALRLKERIAMESKRVEEGTFGVGPFHHFSTQQHPSPARPPFSNDQGYTPSVDLPGVRNVHEHALRAEKLRQEAEAATKIQAAYRGHRMRKSLRWKLPSGRTLGASLREGHTHGGDESRSSSTATLTPPPAEEDEMEKEISTPIVSPLRGHTQKREGVRVHAHVHTQLPTFEANGPPATSSSATAVPRLSPWQQTGGDEHSIINVFTRQHEKLRQTLDQLSDQKRAEIRRFGEEGRAKSETPKHSASSSVPGSQPGATSITHSHSYTYTFEQSSPSKSGSEHSPHSSIFSEDSLHASPPPKHKPNSPKVSPSSTLSPPFHHSSPRSAASPPSRGSSSSTLTNGSPSSKSEPKSKQCVEERVHVITPPGSPSFVESFASISPRSVLSQTSEPKSSQKSPLTKADATAPSAKPPAGSTSPGVQVSSTAAAVPSVTVTEAGGRLSPRSLELKLHSELNLLETVEDSMRQLSQVESARAVSLAQQETVALAQLLKSHQQGHEQELEAVASKGEKEVEEARRKLDREAALMAEQRQRIEREHAEKMQRIREEASRVSHEATLRLNEARTAASDAVIQAAKEHLEAAHKIAETAASAAAREAVKATLIVSGAQQQGPLPPHHHHNETTTASGSITPSYESDFEADSLAGSDSGKMPETQSGLKSTPTRSQASGSSTTTIEEDIEQGGSDMEEGGEGESATPVLASGESKEEAVEVRPGDDTLVGGGGSELEESYRSQSPIEEIEEDISEASFQLLPSESHRRQQRLQQQQAKLSLVGLQRGRDRRSESEGSSFSRGSSPSQGEGGSRVPSPMPSEQSPSPGAGEDSFFQFMNRMVRAYMHEEELRARHQATLLRLREDALQEKTKAHLEWLKIKKKALQSKGDDDKMPPLARMERGLLKKYKQEQAEIHRLKEAQKAARRERRLMLQQQKEISQMRRSAQYYRNKIHQHSRRVAHSPSPSPSLLLDEIQNASSRLLDESELSMGDVSVAEELSESESQRNKKSLTEPLEDLDFEPSLPKEYTEDFASYTTSPEPVLTATVQTETGTGELEGGEGDRTLTAEDLPSQQQTPVRSAKPKIKVSPPDGKKSPAGGKKAKVTRTPKSPSSESHTVKELERLAAIDPHEYLSQREQRLLKRRKAAEEVLKQQQELLKKQQILDKEEEKVNKLVTEALACYQQRTKIKKGRSKERSPHSSDEGTSGGKPRELATPPKHTKSPLVGEERDLGINTQSSVSEEIGASGSITAEVSEHILSQMSSSQPSSAAALQSVHTVTSRGPSEYAMDTFESFHSSMSHHRGHPPHPLPLVTSTPSSSVQGSLKKEPRLSDDLSVSISESVTSMTSDGSGLEDRIRLLKLQLQQKKEEMKRFQTEQKRKKKEVLRQQEEQLKRKLEIVENRAKQLKSAAAGAAKVVPAPSIPLHSPGTTTPTSSGSATPSQEAHSEKSESEMSRESTVSPQPLPTPVADLLHPPHPSVEREAPVIVMADQQQDEASSMSPGSVKEQLSPAAQSNSYTPFSDSIPASSRIPLAPTAGSGDIVHEETVVEVDVGDGRVDEVLSPTTASVPEEQDTSHSTVVEEEEGGGEMGIGEGGDDRQQEPVVAAAVEVEREKEVPGHEETPVAEELSVKSDSISEHISDLSSEGEEEEVVDVEQVTQPSSEVEPQVGGGTPPPLSDEQYTDSFEEPSGSTPASSPSSQAPPIRELTPPPEAHEAATMPVSQAPPLKEMTPPIEPHDEAAIATPADEKPEDTTDITEQNDREQVDIPISMDTKEFAEEVGYQIGQRVLVGNVMAGTVRYIGHTHFAKGIWVGVEIDLPRGRNDGSIDDRRYFTCEPNYGLFAPPQKVTVMEENPEYYNEEGEAEGERQQPTFEDDASSVAEEIEEERLTSEHEGEDDLEDYARHETLDENAALQPPVIAREESPPPVDDDVYSPDFESSPEESEEGGAEADDEEERESEAKAEDGEGIEQVAEVDEHTAVEEGRQEKEDYQWPRSEEGSTRESTPMVEFNHHVEKEETPPPPGISQLLQKHQAEENREKLKTATQPPSVTDREMEKITEDVSSEKLSEKTSQITEHPPPASESLETLGEKSESFPQAPEVANQRSQSATPTPAPPPEFAEGALKDTSIEPPRELQVSGETGSTLKQASEVISEELAQELTNEAYETMHNIWKVKREAQLATKGQATEYEATDVMKIPLDKEAKLSLEDKADRVTDQLLALLLQSETNLACSIHNFKKSQEEEEGLPLRIQIPEKTEEESVSPTSPRTHLPRSPISREPERLVLSPVPEEPLGDEEEAEQHETRRKPKGEEQEEEVTTPPVSPLRRGAPAKLILTGNATSIIESSPPPLSPPSPYRNFVPSFIPAADEFSPPGSPPKHLSQASAARVAAGEKTPFLSSQDKERKGLERSTSTESITSLLDSLTIKTAQCMVPSERANVDQVVERSWQFCEEIGFEQLHVRSPRCPNDILDMFSDLHELSPDENHCRKAYLELVFNLTVETLQNLHVASEATPVWTQESAVRSLLVPEHKNSGGVTLEKVQKKVYKALMRGQLPSQLPAVKFLRGMKRPGGREIDFVDTILIKELREEEPGWIDYGCDEASVKMKTADAILDSLITEAVQIMCDIGKKRQTRINNTHS